MAIKDVIWDLDGNLLDTYPVMMAAYTQAVEAFGGRIDDQAALLREAKLTSVQAIATRMAPQLGVSLEALLDKFHDKQLPLLDQPKPYPGAKEVLNAVVANGGRNYLMTHRDDSAWDLLERLELREFFAGGVTAEAKMPRKPAPDAILWLIERYALEPSTTLMVGDRSLDVDAGHNAGVASAYFNVDGLNAAPSAEIQLSQLTDLIDWLQ